MARARRFYGDVLGLPAGSAADEFDAGNVTLALWQPEADGLTFAPNAAGFALGVDDVPAARRRLEALGVRFLGVTIDTGLAHMALLEDPDGNVLILQRRHATLGE